MRSIGGGGEALRESEKKGQRNKGSLAFLSLSSFLYPLIWHLRGEWRGGEKKKRSYFGLLLFRTGQIRASISSPLSSFPPRQIVEKERATLDSPDFCVRETYCFCLFFRVGLFYFVKICLHIQCLVNLFKQGRR